MNAFKRRKNAKGCKIAAKEISGSMLYGASMMSWLNKAKEKNGGT
jgi:hypothetical protein